MIGMLAFSKSGHDKGKIYIIVGEDGKYVYLCDGNLRPLESPKKKSIKHIQLVKKEVQVCGTQQEAHKTHAFLKSRLMNGGAIYNEEIKLVIKEFKTLGGIGCLKQT